jgi:hypothetical protein
MPIVEPSSDWFPTLRPDSPQKHAATLHDILTSPYSAQQLTTTHFPFCFT